MLSVKNCSNCGRTTKKSAIQLFRDCEQWWHFSSYKTKAGNTHTGLFCPDCSRAVYDENKYKKLDSLHQYVRMTPTKGKKPFKTKGKDIMKTTKTQIEKATILTWKRERNSVYGNPCFSFVITDEAGKVYSGKTRPNAGFVYGLCSYPEQLENVVIAVTPSGRVYMDNADNAK